MKLWIPARKHVHRWKIVYVGRDMLRYFGDDLLPPRAAAAGDIAIGRGCIMRVCETCGEREILRNVSFADGPAVEGGVSEEREGEPFLDTGGPSRGL